MLMKILPDLRVVINRIFLETFVGSSISIGFYRYLCNLTILPFEPDRKQVSISTSWNFYRLILVQLKHKPF